MVRTLNDASKNGISKLYFCARDSYPMYLMAKKMLKFYSGLDVVYFYVSRQSLYEGDNNVKLGYFKQIEIASTSVKNAIVDIRTSGKTLLVLNEILENNGYNKVKGYFFELFPSEANSYRQLGDYYAELNAPYIGFVSSSLRKMLSNWFLYELFFPLNTQKRTIGYTYDDGIYAPMFEDVDKKEYKLYGLDEFVSWREKTLDYYMDCFINLGLIEFADQIFERYAVPQLSRFIQNPDKHYLPALEEFYCESTSGVFLPYVEKSIWKLPLNVLKKRTIWKRGTIVYNIPIWMGNILFKERK